VRLRNDDLEWREIDGEIVVLDLATSRYFAVNRSGAVLWLALSGDVDQPELVALLCERYALDPTAAGAAVEEFLGALRDRDLLSQTDPS